MTLVKCLLERLLRDYRKNTETQSQLKALNMLNLLSNVKDLNFYVFCMK